MAIFSTMIFTVNIMVSQFCSDLNVEKCEVDIEFSESNRLPLVYDPKGVRRAQGLCQDGQVLLNFDHWKMINQWERKELVYHELGHCMLHLGHNDDVSIMNPFPKTTHYHVKEDGSNWKSLVNDLKKRI